MEDTHLWSIVSSRKRLIKGRRKQNDGRLLWVLRRKELRRWDRECPRDREGFLEEEACEMRP